MKLPDVLGSILNKKTRKAETYVSLYIDVFRVAVAFWSMGSDGKANIMASVHESITEDSWVIRKSTIDRLLGILEQRTGQTDAVKTILGLSTSYLTSTGEIRKEVRLEIKQLTRELELKAIGFVPLHESVILKMKKDEGVPPSVILLGINGHSVALTVYKVGTLTGIREVEKHDDIALCVEEGLKSFSDVEVLPARMLLYGSQDSELDEAKRALLHHQWTSKVNFLHFPKIDIIGDNSIIESISLAGASEIGANPPGDTSETKEEEPDSSESEEDEVTAVSESNSEEKTDPITPDDEIKATGIETHTAIANNTPVESDVADVQEFTPADVEKAQEVISEDFSVKQEDQTDANVVMVDAASLGFKKDVDVLEEDSNNPADGEDEFETGVESDIESETEEEELSDETSSRRKFPITIPRISLGGISQQTALLIIIGFIICVIAGVSFWFLPHATVTILEIPKNIESAETIIINPSATSVDQEKKAIPGYTQQQSLSGEKIIPVNGKKSVGEPAKGSVSIYNKSLSSKTFKKGTILQSGTLQFSLDADVQVASASESIGSITFGKGVSAVTAVAIGTQSNLAQGSEFTFKDISSNTAIARNESAFTGGTSRDITVVSRSDYESFVKIMTEELVQKAKAGLAQANDTDKKLIESTIKTAVTEKIFSQELDEEATQLQGKLTISVTGIAYSQSDAQTLLSSLSRNTIPDGYSIYQDKTELTMSDLVVKKDGMISAKARLSATALPILSLPTIQKSLVGKSVKSTTEYFKTLPGVAGIEVSFRLSPTRQRFPINKNNISVTVALSQ